MCVCAFTGTNNEDANYGWWGADDEVSAIKFELHYY